MVSVQMITRIPLGAGAVCLAAAVSLSTNACQRVPLLAPSGSTIQLNASTNVLPVNGTREALFAFAQTVIDPRQQRGRRLDEPDGHRLPLKIECAQSVAVDCHHVSRATVVDGRGLLDRRVQFRLAHEERVDAPRAAPSLSNGPDDQ